MLFRVIETVIVIVSFIGQQIRFLPIQNLQLLCKLIKGEVLKSRAPVPRQIAFHGNKTLAPVLPASYTFRGCICQSL